MTDIATKQASSGALPPETVAVLLESALRARKNGKPAAARALLRALSAQQPDLPQVWLALATVAETRVEQRRALERVIALDPHNAPAQRGLALMGVAAPAIDNPAHDDSAASPVTPEPPNDQINGHASNGDAFLVSEVAPEAIGVALAPPAVVETAPGPLLIAVAPLPAQPARAIRWPLYLVIGLSILAVLLAAFLIRRRDLFPSSQPAAPTPSLSGAVTALPALGDPTAAAALDAPTPAPAQGPAAAATSVAAAGAATAEPAPTAQLPTAIPSRSPLPQPTPRETLAPGQVVKQDQWHAILFRPQDAVVLDGSIGTLQPRGRFVLALVAVGNDGPAPARLPANLFVLIDSAGQRYTPLPQASTAYLNSYGRGQHGDLSMEDMLPAGGSNNSVPLIFDVPPSAHNLYLLVGDSPVGWAVSQ